MLNASKLAFPVKKFNPHTKPYWDHNVKSAHAEARAKRQIWIKENKPRGWSCKSYSDYKTAKKKFRIVQEQAIKEYEDAIYRDIDEAAELDVRLFWKLMNSHKNKNNNNCFEIKYDDKLLNDPNEIASAFGKYFQKSL